MKRVFLMVLILLISGVLTAHAADQVILSENWETGIINPNDWQFGGSPVPQIQVGGNNSRYAVNNNGDELCDSALYTRSQFAVPNGLSAEFSMKPFFCLSCPNSTLKAGFTTSDFVNSGLCRPSEGYYQGLAYVELDGSTRQINYYVKPFGVIFSEAYPDFGWHQYKIEISSTGGVSFFRDGELKASSNKINLNFYFATRFQYWGQAEFEPNLIDDILISEPEPEAPNLLFDSEVDNYTLVSIDPFVDLPPQPLKGLIRITVAIQPFTDIGSASALVISITSLNERFRFGGGSTQTAIPEDVSPLYDSIQTEWEYFNPDCEGPVILEIPQIDCDDLDNLANLLLQLYPPSGSAVISSLGLESAVQCAVGSNNPYAGTLFEAHNTHDTVNYLWFDPADSLCPVGGTYDGKNITILMPFEESATDALAAINESQMALNVKLAIAGYPYRNITEIDILADPFP